MKKFDIELAVGFFLLLGILSLAYISINLGKLEIVGRDGYTVYAEFEKAGGIKPKAIVEIAGVEVGTVKSVDITGDYRARVELTIDKDIKLQEDAIASIKTKGLIGEQYVQISPGGSDKFIPNGGKIRETESAIDIEELISKYVFGKI
ncbi:MAG: outer membrane lipid asymmetry maintenance protein MlaD [Nitrospira bacterium HGW-Nitrospira-1]|nr:MAG: outer membrane lipid asymmetry maintenance protein MlaD [Nitrospira bacterium HGW-Nitrospira-1]